MKIANGQCGLHLTPASPGICQYTWLPDPLCLFYFLPCPLSLVASDTATHHARMQKMLFRNLSLLIRAANELSWKYFQERISQRAELSVKGEDKYKSRFADPASADPA